MTGPDWRSALREELGPLLDSLARGEGAPPALRYRIEGFARAVCSLGLAPPEDVLRCVREAYANALGPSAADYTDDDFRVLEGATHWPCVPVRLPRAPVYTSSAP